MNDVEMELKRLPRRGPSAGLDARVERALAQDAPVFRRPVPAWACALAAAVGIAAGAAATRLAARPCAAAVPGSVFAAASNAGSASFPFVNRSFVQP